MARLEYCFLDNGLHGHLYIWGKTDFGFINKKNCINVALIKYYFYLKNMMQKI